MFLLVPLPFTPSEVEQMQMFLLLETLLLFPIQRTYSSTDKSFTLVFIGVHVSFQVHESESKSPGL